MTTKRVNIRISNLPARQKHGWTAAVRKMLESGSHATIAEIAAAEKINASYVGRVLRLTLLSPPRNTLR
jgi:hypothetical protein